MMADTTIPHEPSPWTVRWTREDCVKLEQAGVLSGRYELIEGSVIRMGQNMPHATAVRLCLRALFSLFGDECIVTQASMDVRPEDNPTNEPMPDLLALTRPSAEFSTHPKPSDVRLLVEVADSTVRFDMTTKAALYARAGIVEYWVLSLPDRTLTVHREPREDSYREVRAVGVGESISPLATPDRSVAVADLLPPETGQASE